MTGALYRLPEGVAFHDDPVSGRAYLARLPQGPISVLQGTAYVIWCAITAESARPGEDAASRVAAVTGLDPEDVRDDVLGFVKDLLDSGLLRPDSDGN